MKRLIGLGLVLAGLMLLWRAVRSRPHLEQADDGSCELVVEGSLSFLAVPAILGVAVAYNARKTAPAWLQSHYLFQIRTFWIGCAGSIMGAAMVFSGRLTIVGLLLWLALVVWTEMRSALGFINIVKLKSYPRPRDWMI